MKADGRARGVEIAGGERPRHRLPGADEAAHRQQQRERGPLDERTGRPQSRRERRDDGACPRRDTHDGQRDERAADEEARRAAVAQPATAGTDPAAHPGHGMQAVRRVAERQVQGHGDDESE